MKKTSILVGLVIFCLSLWSSISYAACSITRGKVEVSQGAGAACTSISTAANLADGVNPLIVSVLPGTYTEGSLTLKSNVHIQGSGRDVTTWNLQGGMITLNGIDNDSISGLTIIMGKDGISCYNCNHLTISDNSLTGPGTSPWGNGGVFIGTQGMTTVKDNIVQSFSYGLDFGNSGVSTISGNTVKGNYYGVYLAPGSNETSITGNIITENVVGLRGGSSNFISNNIISFNTEYGIKPAGDTITGNTIGENGIAGIDTILSGTITGNTINGNASYGISNTSGTTSISNNRITNSGTADIANCGSSKVSLNVYDTFSGGSAVGAYNVKQDGTPAPLQ